MTQPPPRTASPSAAPSARSPRPLFDPDQAAWVGRSDLTHTGRVERGTEGFPVANGRFGGPVWQSGPATLVMQINHTDAFQVNDASAVSEQHRDSGGGGLGRIHLGLGADVFGPDTAQRLTLHTGTLTVDGTGVRVEVSTDPDADLVLITVEDARADPAPVTVDLALLREPDRVWGDHTARSRLNVLPGVLPGGADTGAAPVPAPVLLLEQTFREPCDTGLTVNDFAADTALAVTVRGRDGVTVSRGRVGDRDSLRLQLPAATGTVTVLVGGQAVVSSGSPDTTTTATDTATDTALAAVREAPADAVVRDRSRTWWADFWSRSVVHLPGLPEFEQRRTYFLYLSAICNRGRFPGRYNGGIWIGEEDRRDWGSFYWNWNQDSLHQPLMAANQLELMQPLFRMRQAGLARYAEAARQLWGAEGIFVGETVGVLGWEILPEDVAEALRRYHAFELDEPPALLTAFTERRNRYLTPWNWNVEGGHAPASYVTHTLVATAETAEHLWAAYHYTLDLDWLREVAYPFLRGAAELYRTFGGLRLEDDGLYHVTGTNLHEHIWAGRDVIDDLALARGTFGAAVRAAELLDVDATERVRWAEIAAHLAPYPLRTDSGALWAATTEPGLAERLATDAPAWAQGLEPASFVRDQHGTESPILKMVEKFDVLTLETRDQGLDGGDWAIAENTFRHSPGWLNQVENAVVDRNGSSRFHVDAARLGRADDLARILRTQYGVFDADGAHPNLLSDQGDYYSAEGYGTFVAAVQEGLLQSIAPSPGGEPVIRVFPAWPRDQDADLRLLAKGGFLVGSSLRDGEIGYVELVAQLGGTARIRKPWAGPALLFRGGDGAGRPDWTEVETLDGPEGDLLEIATAMGERIVLVRPGSTPEDHRRTTVGVSKSGPVSPERPPEEHTGQ